MTTTIDFRKLLSLIESESGFLLTSHQDPDGDSIGSLIGLNRFLKGLGKKTIIYNQGRLPEKYDFLDPDGDIKFAPERADFEPSVAFILECPNIERIGFVMNLLNERMTIVNIDHHTSNTMFGTLNYIDEDACAVAEILLNIIRAGGFKITPQIAEPFYAAIASDTGRF
jgi:phosphoesterase RecJ-like protein